MSVFFHFSTKTKIPCCKDLSSDVFLWCDSSLAVWLHNSAESTCLAYVQTGTSIFANLTSYWQHFTKSYLSVTQFCWLFPPCRGILVKLVIYVSRGHWKAKIPNYWKSYCFGYHVPVYTAYDEKKTTGHLIAPFTSLVCLIHRFPMSPRDKYFLYHVFTWQIACILHKSFVTGAIKIQFICETIQRHCCLHIMSQE